MSRTRSRDRLPGRQSSAFRVQSCPYSLAGPPPSQLGRLPTGSSSHDGSSIRTRRHRYSNTQDEEESSSQPIWGLAAPLPRVRRAGMDRRSTDQQHKSSTDSTKNLQKSTSNLSKQPSAPSGTQPAPQVEVTPDRHEEQSHQPSAPSGTQPAPQVGVTPDRHEEHDHQPSDSSGNPPAPQVGVTPDRHEEHNHHGGQNLGLKHEKAVRQTDLLRRATTAHASTLHEGLDRYSSLQSDDAVGKRESHRSQELAAEHISAQDQATSQKSPSETSRPNSTFGPSLRKLPSRSTAQDPAQLKIEDLIDGRNHSRVSEPAIEDARRHLQDLADTAPYALDSGHHPPNIDWEDINETHDEKHSSSAGYDPTEVEYFNRWGRVRSKLRQPFAEFLGTVAFMTIGLCGSVVRTASPDDYGNLLTAYLAWGLGVMIGIYIAGGVSGGHLNPAVSIVLSVFRGFPWSLCWQYIVAQMLGSITASGIVYGLYKDTIEEYQASKADKLGPAFWTQPRSGLSNASAFFTEFTATAIAAGSVLALGDDRNSPPGAGMHAFIIGLLIIALQMAFSYNTGTALNPARDFGPRLITWAAGFGSKVFTMKGWWWIWGPWVGTITGGLFGAFCYDALIFLGGESPVNYPTRDLGQRIRSWGDTRNLSKMGRGKDAQDEIAKRLADIA